MTLLRRLVPQQKMLRFCLWLGTDHSPRTGLLCFDIRFEVEEVVHWMAEVLFTAKIAFGSQNGSVSQQAGFCPTRAGNEGRDPSRDTY